MQKKLAQIKARIRSNVKVQEGDTPNEDPNELMVDASQIITELSSLIERIHRTNAIAVTDTESDRYSHREIK